MFLVAIAGLVTVTITPCPLPLALEKLSAAIGERLECVPALRNETMVARLKDADHDRVLKEIAKAYDAKWEADGTRLVLKGDPRIARLREAAGQRKRASEIAGKFATLAKAVAALKPFDRAVAAEIRKQTKAWEELKKKFEEGGPTNGFPDIEIPETPTSRAGRRLLLAIGPAALGSLKDGERAVWSEFPTAMQRAFPTAANGALSTYRQELSLTAVDGRNARVRLIVASRGGSAFNVSVQTLDAKGNATDEAEVDFDDGDSGDEVKKAPAVKSDAKEKTFELPEECAEYFTLFNSRPRAMRGELFEKWRPRLADPVSFEPTAWYPAVGLIAAAEAQGRNMIVAPGDYSQVRFARPQVNLTASAFVADLREYSYCDVQDDWIVGGDQRIVKTVGRSETRDLYARALRQGGLDIDAAGAWLENHPDSWPAMSWVGVHLGALLTNTVFIFDESTVGLWGAFGTSAQTALRRGDVVRLSALPADAQRKLYEQIYGAESTDEVEREITEALPFGLVNGTVALSVTQETVVTVWSEAKGEPVYRNLVTADTLGRQLGRNQRRNVDLGYDRYRVGTKKTYHLKFTFGPERVTFTRDLEETFLPPNASPVNRLPEEFLRRTEIAKQRILDDPDEAPPDKGIRPR